jgi:glycosyltransferase involved in cell wall biosynthesis
MSPYVSVILPVYNNERTVLSAVQSILKQSFTDFELIIVNDGCTDQTIARLSELQDERIKIIGDADNLGLPRRLNQGLDAARGKYIARMDGDDLSRHDRFLKQVTFLDKNPEIDLVAGRAAVFDDEGRILGLLPFAGNHDQITCRVWNNIPMPHPTWMMRKEWGLKHRYAVPEIWRAEDQDLLLRAYKQSHYACLEDILLYYRQGRFNFKKSFLARRHQLKSQLGYFVGQKEYGRAIASCCVFFAKSGMDLARPFIGVHNFSPDVSPEIKSDFEKLFRA